MKTIDGPYMLTCTGRYVSPLFPHDWEPDINEIGHHLSQVNRFNGATVSTTYSVAEHACRVSDLLPEGLRLAGLLHDAAEAYVGDWPSYLKHHPMIGEAYRSVERALQQRIDEFYGVHSWHELVHDADLKLLCTEKRDLLPEDDAEWLVLRGVKPLKDQIVPWSPAWARHNFMGRFYSLTRTQAAA